MIKPGETWTDKYDTAPYRGHFQQDMVASLCPRCGGTGTGEPGEKYYEMGTGTFGCSHCNSYGWNPEKVGAERLDIEATRRDPRVPARALEPPMIGAPMEPHEIAALDARNAAEAMSHEKGCRCWYCLCTRAGGEAASERDSR